MRWLLAVFFLVVLSCKTSNTNEEYEIYNTVLRERVTTYGIMASYLPYDRYYSETERENFALKIQDSLRKTKSLTYYLNARLTLLDTLNPNDEFATGNPILVEFKRKFSEDSIDLSKIKELEIASRVKTSEYINDNEKWPTYLGSYDLSKPIFVSHDKAVIRLEHHCGSKCGIGVLIYLDKIDSQWRISNEKITWIS